MIFLPDVNVTLPSNLYCSLTGTAGWRISAIERNAQFHCAPAGPDMQSESF